MKPTRIALLGITIAIAAVWAYAYRSRTPDGVNVTPLLSISARASAEQFDLLKDRLPAKAVRGSYANTGEDRISYYRDAPDGVFRHLQFSRFQAGAGALAEYESLRATFSKQGWSLFREDTPATGRYFSAYKKAWINTNHGIPIGIVTDPEILVAYNVDKLLVVVSYVSHGGDGDYIRALNEDLAYVADLLRKSAEEAK